MKDKIAELFCVCGRTWEELFEHPALYEKKRSDKEGSVYIAGRRVACPGCGSIDTVFVRSIRKAEPVAQAETKAAEPEPVTLEPEPKLTDVPVGIEPVLDEPVTLTPEPVDIVVEPEIKEETEEEFYGFLVDIKGIGKRTANKIVDKYPTRAALKKALDENPEMLYGQLRDDVVDVLKKKLEE